jgi:hypothetical protein
MYMLLLILPAVSSLSIEFQHMGHHASLGKHSLEDISFPSIKSEANRVVHHSAASWSHRFLFPDSDGDALVVGTLSFGRILEKWGSKGDPVDHSNVFLNENELRELHEDKKYMKCLIIQGLHLGHHMYLTVLYFLGIFIVPPISIPAFLWPERVTKWTISVYNFFYPLKESGFSIEINSRHRLTELDDDEGFSATGISASLNAESSTKVPASQPLDDAKTDHQHAAAIELIASVGVNVVASIGIHAWLWVGFDAWLLFSAGKGADNPWSAVSVGKGLLYLYLSELFLYGFAMHPFMVLF